MGMLYRFSRTASLNLVADPRSWTLQLAIICVGLVLRVLEYIRKDSLWGDEAMLSLNIVSRPFHELLRPLAYAQVAPVPFLWAERLTVVLFGVNEWTLRSLPLIAGSALCVAVALLARRMLPADEALVALTLVAFSLILIRYSAEVKPYSWDALVAVGLVGAAAGLLGQVDRAMAWWRLGALGAVAILVSFTSLFICLGVGVALGLQLLVEKRANLLPRMGLLGLVWAILFTVAYAQFYQEEAAAPYLRSFWERAFLVPGSPFLLARTRVALLEVAWGIYPGLALVGLSALTFSLVLLGAVALCRRGQATYALLLLVPGVVPFAASALGTYPIATRLMLFTAPLFIMLAAVGVIFLARLIHRLVPTVPGRWIAIVLLLPAVTSALARHSVKARDQQMSPLVQALTERWREGDAVYVFHRVVPAWLFYSTTWSEPNLRQLAWAMRVSGPGGVGHENGPTRGSRPPGEGTDLVYNLSGHCVLLGTSSGVQGRAMFGYLPRQPDTAWAANESRRMRSAAHPRLWIILGNASHEGVNVGEILLNAVGEAGGKLTLRYSLQDGALYQVEFPPRCRGKRPHCVEA